MGSGGLPSGGVTKVYGRIGSLPRFGAKANSRIDLYIRDGKRVQSRWYDHNGIVIRNRDYSETKYGIHDHLWSPYTETYNENGILKAKTERDIHHIAPDYQHYPSEV